MKDSHKRFASIKRLAEKKEKDAAARFGKERRDRDDASRRLEELRQYHREYLQRYADAARSGRSVSRLRDYQVFIDKLEAAIREQEHRFEQQVTRCDQAKNAWAERYTHSRSVENLIERKQKEAQEVQLRGEQRLLDDHNPRGR